MVDIRLIGMITVQCYQRKELWSSPIYINQLLVKMTAKKLPFLTKFLYGFGSMSYGIKDNAFAYFLLFVYVQIFGLAPDLAGLAILLMLVFDAS